MCIELKRYKNDLLILLESKAPETKALKARADMATAELDESKEKLQAVEAHGDTPEQQFATVKAERQVANEEEKDTPAELTEAAPCVTDERVRKLQEGLEQQHQA